MRRNVPAVPYMGVNFPMPEPKLTVHTVRHSDAEYVLSEWDVGMALLSVSFRHYLAHMSDSEWQRSNADRILFGPSSDEA